MQNISYKIAHDYLFVNYVCTNGKHYPLEFRRFQKKDDCASRKIIFKDHTVLCQELIDWVCERNIPGTFAFDSYFTNALILNHIQGKRQGDGQIRGYVGSLKFNRKLQYKGREVKASDLAKQIAPAIRKSMQRGDRKQWYFTCTLRIPDVNHKVRIVIIWQNREDEQPRIILVTNRIAMGGQSGRARVSDIAGQARKPFIGMASNSWAWETVSCGTARARPGTCTWSWWRTVS